MSDYLSTHIIPECAAVQTKIIAELRAPLLVGICVVVITALFVILFNTVLHLVLRYVVGAAIAVCLRLSREEYMNTSSVFTLFLV